MAENRRMAVPNGTPHDIAMMAYHIAERAMAYIDQHEKDCAKRWEAQNASMERQRDSMEALRSTALSNFSAATADRADFRERLTVMTSMINRAVAWVIPALAAGLCGTVWWIITHPPH